MRIWFVVHEGVSFSGVLGVGVPTVAVVGAPVKVG